MPWVQVGPKITEQVATVSHQAGACIKTQEDLLDLRHYMGRDKYFKDKGFGFGMIAYAINDWSLARHETPVRSNQSATSPSSAKQNEPTDDEVAAMRLKAAQMQEKMLAERAARKEKRA